MTGEALTHRTDDHEETIKKRLGVYHSQTEPLIKYYTSAKQDDESHPTIYIKVDGIGSVEEVSKRIFNAIEKSQASM